MPSDNVNCYAQFQYIGLGYKHLLDGNLVGEYENEAATEVGIPDRYVCSCNHPRTRNTAAAFLSG